MKFIEIHSFEGAKIMTNLSDSEVHLLGSGRVFYSIVVISCDSKQKFSFLCSEVEFYFPLNFTQSLDFVVLRHS